jgi:hypothetical protein
MRVSLTLIIATSSVFATQEWVINEFDENKEQVASHKFPLSLSNETFGNEKLDEGTINPDLKNMLDDAILFTDFKEHIAYKMNDILKVCKGSKDLVIACDFHPIPSLMNAPGFKKLSQTRSIKRMSITGCREPMPDDCSIDLSNKKKYIRDSVFQARLEVCAEALLAIDNRPGALPSASSERHKK